MSYRYQFKNYDDADHYSLDNDAELSGTLSYFGPDVASTIVQVRSRGANDPSEIARLSSKLAHLRTLVIRDTPLTDVDLLPLVALTRIRGLHLQGTAITDESVLILSQLQSLVVLNVENTSLSESAIDELRAALPHARIWFGPVSGSMSGGMM
ncbi:hypothetical protein [Rosistilla oblonga]|uniref:hypothetical protein n=1 Tax=Rosistilla oblonga TaxID=2527990 RepID=UPI00119E8219|nr:hypothetical protein [Rosistilla oblonga]